MSIIAMMDTIAVGSLYENAPPAFLVGCGEATHHNRGADIGAVDLGGGAAERSQCKSAIHLAADPRLLALLDGPTMLPVEMTPDAEASGAEKARPGPVEDAMIEVALPSGARVRFSAGVDMATLENVLVAVRRSA